MIVRIPRNVRLPDIAGVSPLNPRQQIDDDGLDGLAASLIANGTIEDILVETRDGALLVLDGSRRWRAFQRLVETDRIAADAEIGVVEIVGCEADKREVALAANFHRLDLHPVERFEAFAGMAQAGRSEGEIAAHFHIEPRDVKRHLALGRLAPEIRAAWKEGAIDSAAAQAFTIVRDQSRQLAIFSSLGAMNRNSPHEIRRLLRGDAVIASAAIAVFARAEYLEAGGAIEESLFEDQAFFEDGPLLRKLAEKKLRAVAERVQKEQGWGFAVTEFEDQSGHTAVPGGVLPDYLAKEQRRLDEIEALELSHASAEDSAKLAREAEDIMLRAWARGVSARRRADLGICVELDRDGHWFMDVVARKSDAPTAEEVADAVADAIRDRVDQARARVAAPAAVPSVEPNQTPKKLDALMRATVQKALASSLSGNLNLALAFAVASIGTNGGGLSNLRSFVIVDDKTELLGRISRLRFAEALAICVNAPLADLTVSFATLVGATVEATNADMTTIGAALKAAARISAVDCALEKKFDAELWFSTAPKADGLAVIRELLGETAYHDAQKAPRGKIAEEATRVAADRKWLPAPLAAIVADIRSDPERQSDAAGAQSLTLANAMQLALEADVDGQAVARFLETRVKRGDGLRIRATELHEAFVGFCVAEGIEGVPGLGAFGTIVKRLGIARYRHKTGIFYTGVALTKATAEPQQMAAE